MKKVFTTNLFLLLILNLLVKPLWIFGVDRTVQNMVGAEEYGLFYSLFNFSLLLNIILDFGINNFNNREISRHAHLASKYVSNIISIKFLLAAAYSVLCFVFAYALGYNGREVSILLFLVLNQFIASFILYFRSSLSGLQFFKTDSVLSVLDRFLMIIICGILIWGGIDGFHFSIEWFIYAQTISYSITLAVTLIILKTNLDHLKVRFEWAFAINILKQSYPYAILALLMSLYSRVDSVMIERLLPNGKEESGIYAQAFRIVDAANMLPFLFASLLLPIFSKMIKNKESIEPFVGFSFTLLFLPAFIISLIGIAYRNDIMQLLYHQHTSESSTLLGLLMVSFFIISINYIFGTLLTANGNVMTLNIISLFGVIVSFVVNLLLIPTYYSMGAAIANLTAQASVATIQIIIAYRTFQFKLTWRKMLPYFLYIPITITIIFITKNIGQNWLLSILISLVSSVLLGFLLRVVNLRELYATVFKE